LYKLNSLEFNRLTIELFLVSCVIQVGVRAFDARSSVHIGMQTTNQGCGQHIQFINLGNKIVFIAKLHQRR